MLLQLQPYTFTIVYKLGKEMIFADILSCTYINSRPNKDLEDLMYAVNSVMDNLPISDHKLKVIRENDSTLTKLKDTIKSGWPEKEIRDSPRAKRLSEFL